MDKVIERIKEKEKKIRRRRKTAGITAFSVCAVIMCAIFAASGKGVMTGEETSAAALFAPEKGAIVMIACIAFMAGVIITAICYYARRKKIKKKGKESSGSAQGEGKRQ